MHPYRIPQKINQQSHFYPMDCSPPSSSVHGMLQARILEWVAISFSRGCSLQSQETQGLKPGLLHCRQTLYRLSHREDLQIHPKEVKTGFCRNVCILLFIAAFPNSQEVEAICAH